VETRRREEATMGSRGDGNGGEERESVMVV